MQAADSDRSTALVKEIKTKLPEQWKTYLVGPGTAL